MSATVADLNPKTLESAKRQFVELYGSALVLNTYLKVALLLMSLLALGLLALNFRTQAKYATLKPLVVRIDDVGRAEAVQYDAGSYHPQPPELRYFLTQFVVKHFSRLRATVQREYSDSLFFLDPTLAGALSFLAPYKAALFRLHGTFIVSAALIVFLNLCALFYALARWLFLRDTGRKLTHVDRQLISSEGVHEDLPPQLWSTRG